MDIRINSGTCSAVNPMVWYGGRSRLRQSPSVRSWATGGEYVVEAVGIVSIGIARVRWK
jgi:hypothetical protein